MSAPFDFKNYSSQLGKKMINVHSSNKFLTHPDKQKESLKLCLDFNPKCNSSRGSILLIGMFKSGFKRFIKTEEQFNELQKDIDSLFEEIVNMDFVQNELFVEFKSCVEDVQKRGFETYSQYVQNYEIFSAKNIPNHLMYLNSGFIPNYQIPQYQFLPQHPNIKRDFPYNTVEQEEPPRKKPVIHEEKDESMEEKNQSNDEEKIEPNLTEFIKAPIQYFNSLDISLDQKFEFFLTFQESFKNYIQKKENVIDFDEIAIQNIKKSTNEEVKKILENPNLMKKFCEKLFHNRISEAKKNGKLSLGLKKYILKLTGEKMERYPKKNEDALERLVIADLFHEWSSSNQKSEFIEEFDQVINFQNCRIRNSGNILIDAIKNGLIAKVDLSEFIKEIEILFKQMEKYFDGEDPMISLVAQKKYNESLKNENQQLKKEIESLKKTTNENQSIKKVYIVKQEEKLFIKKDEHLTDEKDRQIEALKKICESQDLELKELERKVE
eukprot:gene2571-3533_t